LILSVVPFWSAAMEVASKVSGTRQPAGRQVRNR
jgi:hypothetical protein